MRTLLIAAALFSTTTVAVPAWAQGQAGQSPSSMDPVDLAANCQALKKGSAHDSHRNSTDTQKLMARCADLNRHTAIGARQR